MLINVPQILGLFLAALAGCLLGVIGTLVAVRPPKTFPSSTESVPASVETTELPPDNPQLRSILSASRSVVETLEERYKEASAVSALEDESEAKPLAPRSRPPRPRQSRPAKK
jgi:hypothetical protein